MAETALTPTKRMEAAKNALARFRASAEKRSAKLQRLGTGLIAAYAVGAWEKSNHASGTVMPTVMGLNHLLVYGLAMYLGGEMVGGRNGELLEDAGFGLLCAYAHDAGAHATT